MSIFTYTHIISTYINPKIHTLLALWQENMGVKMIGCFSLPPFFCTVSPLPLGTLQDGPPEDPRQWGIIPN